ncbi:MAG: rhomboid family intramembrane serine protease [Crocinitomicaceae bacterium]|nr:rhomboid family intramembrane serine protease [Crocinitomicaceae bacterium]
MQEKNVFQYLKEVYKSAGLVGKLITINLIVFLSIGIIGVAEFLFKSTGITEKVVLSLAGPGNPEEILYKPWTLITQLFLHTSFFHFLFNMVMLFFAGRMFAQFFGEKRLLSTYLIGGIFGYLTHVICYYSIPAFQDLGENVVIGASGAIYALLAAIAFHRPNLSVYLFGLLKMPIIVLVLFMLLVDFLSLGKADGIAHLVHLGGGVFGALSIINVHSPGNFMNRFERFTSRIRLPKFSGKRKPKMKVYKQKDVKQMDDDKYREVKKDHQERIDAILDKISKKGYEGLTKEEKEILFNESKRK